MWGVPCQVSGVTCQVSHVRCQVSHVTCEMSLFSIFFFYKEVELVGGGSVINGAYPDILKVNFFERSQFCLLNTLRRKMAKIYKHAHKEGKNWQKKSVQWNNSWTSQLAQTNHKILCKVRDVLRRRTAVRRWHLEILGLRSSISLGNEDSLCPGKK